VKVQERDILDLEDLILKKLDVMEAIVLGAKEDKLN
jgi:hypothetical protein